MFITGTIYTGRLIVNRGKLGWDGSFGTFWDGMEDFEESGPENEIPERDLDFGGGGRVGRKGEMVEKGVQCLKMCFL